MMIRIKAFALLAAVVGLGACGQSGPLYLPGNPSRIPVENPGENPGEDAGEDAPGAAGDDPEADAEDDHRD